MDTNAILAEFAKRPCDVEYVLIDTDDQGTFALTRCARDTTPDGVEFTGWEG